MKYRSAADLKKGLPHKLKTQTGIKGSEPAPGVCLRADLAHGE